MASAIQWKLLDSQVAHVVIDLQGSKVNVLSEVVMAELNQTLDDILANSQHNKIRGLIFSSGKPGNFIAGADVNAIRTLQKRPITERYYASQLGKAIFDKIESLPFPAVAAINGICLGGGTELTLACKFRIAATNRKTKIGLPEVLLGFVPGWGGTYRMPHLIGIPGAIELITSGKTVDAKKAWKLGLVDEACTEEKLLKRAEEIAINRRVQRYEVPFKIRAVKWLAEHDKFVQKFFIGQAKKIIMRETKGNYPAPIEALRLIISNFEREKSRAYASESRVFARLAATSVSKNLVGIFFADEASKKMPDNSGPPQEIKKIAVLGAGVMGAGIAQLAAYAGYQVILKDIEIAGVDASQQPIAKGMRVIHDLFEKLVSRHKMTQEYADKMIAQIKPTTKYADLSDVDLVIEAVVEKIEVKRAVLADCEKAISKPFIFASNTSSLSISEMATNAREPGHVIGIHFFNPVHKMPLIEVVRGKLSSDRAVAAGKTFALKLNKKPVVTADAPGFIVNRILSPYLREAVQMFSEGVPIENMEKAMKNFGMPMGPFELLDEIGLDIAAHVLNTMHVALGERMAAPAIMNQVTSLKLLGKKGGKGFYLFDENGKKTELNPEVLAAVQAPRTPIRNEVIQRRLVLAMVNEAARCLEENIVSDVSQLDFAMIMGTGFPPFRGGVLRYADQLGAKDVFQNLFMLSKVAGENYHPAKLIEEKALLAGSFYSDC